MVVWNKGDGVRVDQQTKSSNLCVNRRKNLSAVRCLNVTRMNFYQGLVSMTTRQEQTLQGNERKHLSEHLSYSLSINIVHYQH